MKFKYPLKLKACCKSTVWGGNLLRTDYNMVHDGDNIGESWNLTCREKEKSIIENGPLAGMTINDYIKEFGNDTIAAAYSGDRFPLLIKLLNSESDLSVQVHPNDAYVLEKHGEFGKNEMWYIIEAKEGSELVVGTKNYNRSEFKKAAEAGKLDDLLKHVKVKAGDCFFIPSGLVHAIGSGILLYEVQQNSDITYRVYDYDRVDKSGNKRELHLANALDVIYDYTDDEIQKLAFAVPREKACADSCVLVSCSDFLCEKAVITDDAPMLFKSAKNSFLALTFVNGNGSIEYDGDSYPCNKGSTYFIPADMGEFYVKGRCEIICASI